MESIKHYLLVKWIKLSAKISKFSSKIYMPYSRKKINGVDYFDYLNNLRIGHVLATKSLGEISNVGIPGFFSHVAIVVSNTHVVEATTHGVVKTDLVSFFMNKDYIVAQEPLFANEWQRKLTAQKAIDQIGKQYDFEFNSSDIEKFYCSELVTWSYNQIVKNFPFKTREIMGRQSVLPQDFLDATDKWKTAWESKSYKEQK